MSTLFQNFFLTLARPHSPCTLRHAFFLKYYSRSGNITALVEYRYPQWRFSDTVELFPPILHWQDEAVFRIFSTTKQYLYREPEGAIALLLPTIAGENRRVLLERLQNRKVKTEKLLS